MSDQSSSRHSDFGHLRCGTTLARYYGVTFDWRLPVLRIIRIALLTLVPALALGTLASACSDDTTSVTTGDMAVTVHDLAGPPVVHDLSPAGD
jgi:hypothetical protein